MSVTDDYTDYVDTTHIVEEEQEDQGQEEAKQEEDEVSAYIQVYSGGKSYACQQCDKSFTTSGNLKRHKQTHS